MYRTSVIIRVILLWFALACGFPTEAVAQAELPMPKKVTKHITDTLQLTYSNHLPVIEVTIHGLSYFFLIDTGSSICASFSPDINKELTELMSVNVSDANGNNSKLTTGKLDRLQIGRHVFEGVYFSAQNFLSMRCAGIDGVIGYSVLRKLCVKFDVRKEQCIISDDNTIVKSENKDLKVNFETTNMGMPIFKISPLPRIDQSVGFDTGSSEFYVLSTRHYQAQKNIFGRTLRDIAYGGIARLSLLGEDRQELRRKFSFPNFKFGTVPIRDVDAQLIDDQNSYLGGALLELGTLTLDYNHECYYFKTYETISAGPAMKEVTVVPSKKGLEVGVVWRMTKAFEKGIRASQRVLEINGKPVTDPCEALFRINESGVHALKTMDDEGKTYEWMDDIYRRANHLEAN